MTSKHYRLPVSVKRKRTLYVRQQKRLSGTNRRLDPPRCPDLVPQSRRHEAQSHRKSVRRIRTPIHHHDRPRDQEQNLAKAKTTTTTTATTAPSAAELGGVERSNLSSAWGGSFDTPILDGLPCVSGAQHSALVDLKELIDSSLWHGHVDARRIPSRSAFVIHESSLRGTRRRNSRRSTLIGTSSHQVWLAESSVLLCLSQTERVEGTVIVWGCRCFVCITSEFRVIEGAILTFQ
jgi:hypothetical protein